MRASGVVEMLYHFCDIVIYNKKCMCGLCLLSGAELLKPLEFPK